MLKEHKSMPKKIKIMKCKKVYEIIGIELNSPDDDKWKKGKNKDMVKIVNEKIYESTKMFV
jgi:hypothetical protein